MRKYLFISVLMAVLAIGCENETASSGNKTPGGNDQNPGGNDQNPGGNDQNPGGNDQNPGGNDQNPADGCRKNGCPGNQQCGANKVCCDSLCGENCCVKGEICGSNKACCRHLCGDACCGKDQLCTGNVCCDENKRCGNSCCARDEICDKSLTCGKPETLCGDVFCKGDQVCVNAKCRVPCETDNRCTLADGTEVCCGKDDKNKNKICVNQQCQALTVECDEDFICENDQYCNTELGYCVEQPKGKPCQAALTGSELIPELKWHWGANPATDTGGACPNNIRVMSAPMVADLDKDGFPEVVFNAYDHDGTRKTTYMVDAVVRVVDGRDGTLKATFPYDATNLAEEGIRLDHPKIVDNENPVIRPHACSTIKGTSQTALGDLNKDGYPDIITCDAERDALIAFDFKNRKVLWRAEALGYAYCGQSGPGITDFDGDGNPEVYVGYTIVNGQTGEYIYTEACGGWSKVGFGSGYAHRGCEYNVAADLDGDALPELVGSRKVIKCKKNDKNELQCAPDPQRNNPDNAEGYVAVADIDKDGKPDIVVVDTVGTKVPTFHTDRDGFERNERIYLRLYNAEYKKIASTEIKIHQKLLDDHVIDEWLSKRHLKAGPPNIANINDSPSPEITFATGIGYRAYAYDGSDTLKLLWERKTKDESSQKTGSSIFDFDGDGKAEAVYADEDWLRIYDGENGNTKYCMRNSSGTHWEYPVIVDVDADGATEIVLSSNLHGIDLSRYRPENSGNANYRGDGCIIKYLNDKKSTEATNGVRVFKGPKEEEKDGWIPTRQIWNQHAYYVTNVNKDGSIPKKIIPNWSRKILNNFRLNVEPGATYLPNFDIEDVKISEFYCADTVTLYVTVTNKGWAPNKVPVLLRVTMKNEDGSDPIDKDINIDDTLMPNESKELEFQFRRGDRQIKQFSVTVNPGNAIAECGTDNNQKTLDYSCVPSIN